MWTRRRHFGKIKAGMVGIQNIFYAFRKIEILSSYILPYDISLLSINCIVSCKCPVSNILIKSGFVYWVTASFKVDQAYKISKIIFPPY